MIELPVPELPSPREEVIEILAEGLWELVVRGRRPNKRRVLSAQPTEDKETIHSSARYQGSHSQDPG